VICSVVGARPNFVKMAPIVLEARRRGISQIFVHTGQHYDTQMSKVFFDELQMPEPDIYLGVGSGSHAVQTARVMMAFEEVCQSHAFRLVIVAGDVNSTVACALTATKLHIPVAHVEAGLRSFDRQMPEEINRILTDHISDLLFITEPSGRKNLLDEGISQEKMYFVGNTMIDSLRTHLQVALQRAPWQQLGVEPGQYALVTLHRPANVDHPEVLRMIMKVLGGVGKKMPVLFPVHPRTRQRLAEFGIEPRNIRLVDPLGYLDFLGLMSKSRLVLTDSGGIQEETTALRVPCVTIRENTERPVTVEQGTNILAGTQQGNLEEAIDQALLGELQGQIPELWDGKAAFRVVDILENWLY